MPFVRSSFSCLAPRDLVIGCVKRTSRNGIPTFSSIDVPQSSPDFVGWFFGRSQLQDASSQDSIVSRLLEGRWKYW